jgi:hypothetical protein
VRELFTRYAAGGTSLKALVVRSRAIGLTHRRGNRPLHKSDLHRMLQNPIYYGEYMWLGRRYHGAHEPLISRETFDAAQAVLKRKPRQRYPKQQHAFMGLLTCGQCGCAITAERKKGKYVYYHCTDFHGGCEYTYIREDRLGDLLADVIKPIQISEEIAADLAKAIHTSDRDAERHRADALRQLEQRRQAITSKLDRGTKTSWRGASRRSSGCASQRAGKRSCESSTPNG